MADTRDFEKWFNQIKPVLVYANGRCWYEHPDFNYDLPVAVTGDEAKAHLEEYFNKEVKQSIPADHFDGVSVVPELVPKTPPTLPKYPPRSETFWMTVGELKDRIKDEPNDARILFEIHPEDETAVPRSCDENPDVGDMFLPVFGINKYHNDRNLYLVHSY